jgi:beta-glucosidase
MAEPFRRPRTSAREQKAKDRTQMSQTESNGALTFPENFLWGAAAASYQIEGAAAEDGKGPSDWDMFTQKPGAIFEGHSGDVACDHYHRYTGDVQLMRELGMHAYRLSFSWPRLLPEGTGKINPKGLAFYDRLIDSLLEAGVAPWVTLFHWDYPLRLFERGGWLSPDSSSWFADYAALVAHHFSDRVTNFFTLNEPQVFLGFGHHEGRHAPGLELPLSVVLRAGHNVLLAHGKAVLALRAGQKRPLEIGYAPVGMPKTPASDRPEDLELARRATFEVTVANCWNNAWWMDPVYLGRYPEQGLKFYGKDAPDVGADDFKIICQPLDFFGINIYQSHTVMADEREPSGYRFLGHPPGFPITGFNWPITPEALYYGPRFFAERYKKPILITENGLSCRDWVSLDGKVHDPGRIDFTRRYLREFRRAIADGTPAKGYFHWSIMDNFEWSAGYRERFGLIHVDYETQVRTPKDSFYWYQDVIRTNGAHI